MAEQSERTRLAAQFDVVRFYPKNFKSGSFRNDEGRDLFYLVAPAEGPIKARAVYTTGYGGSINLDYAAIRKFQERGIEVYAMDWINQGLSDRDNSTDIRDANSRLLTRNMLDLQTFVEDVVPKDPQTPLLMVTNSMGGNIGMLHMKHFPNVFDGAILAAPMLDLNTSILPRPLFKGIVAALNDLGLGDKSLPDFRGLLNRIGATSKNINDLSAHPEDLTLTEQAQLRVAELLKPTDIHFPTWQGIRQFYPVMDELRRPEFYSDINTPILFLEGDKDELISNKIINRAAAALPHGQRLELPHTGHGVWTATDATDQAARDARIDRFLEKDIKRPFMPAAPALPALTGQVPVAAVSHGNELAYG